jgi:23S rRNA (guanine2445-N2)-methyltransferase / 23S rRNA (guanine2069-N7)-methyltransferase
LTIEHRYFATAARGIEYLLADELRQLGAREVREARAGVHFAGDLATGYRACLWSRLASRVLFRVAEYAAPDAPSLYAATHALDWDALHALISEASLISRTDHSFRPP